MKNRYLILSDEPGMQAFMGEPVEVETEAELEVSAEQERAMIAAGWISERIEEKKKGEK